MIEKEERETLSGRKRKRKALHSQKTSKRKILVDFVTEPTHFPSINRGEYPSSRSQKRKREDLSSSVEVLSPAVCFKKQKLQKERKKRRFFRGFNPLAIVDGVDKVVRDDLGRPLQLILGTVREVHKATSEPGPLSSVISRCRDWDKPGFPLRWGKFVVGHPKCLTAYPVVVLVFWSRGGILVIRRWWTGGLLALSDPYLSRGLAVYCWRVDVFVVSEPFKLFLDLCRFFSDCWWPPWFGGVAVVSGGVVWGHQKQRNGGFQPSLRRSAPWVVVSPLQPVSWCLALGVRFSASGVVDSRVLSVWMESAPGLISGCSLVWMKSAPELIGGCQAWGVYGDCEKVKLVCAPENQGGCFTRYRMKTKLVVWVPLFQPVVLDIGMYTWRYCTGVPFACFESKHFQPMVLSDSSDTWKLDFGATISSLIYYSLNPGRKRKWHAEGERSPNLQKSQAICATCQNYYRWDLNPHPTIGQSVKGAGVGKLILIQGVGVFLEDYTSEVGSLENDLSLRAMVVSLVDEEKRMDFSKMDGLCPQVGTFQDGTRNSNFTWRSYCDGKDHLLTCSGYIDWGSNTTMKDFLYESFIEHIRTQNQVKHAYRTSFQYKILNIPTKPYYSYNTHRGRETRSPLTGTSNNRGATNKDWRYWLYRVHKIKGSRKKWSSCNQDRIRSTDGEAMCKNHEGIETGYPIQPSSPGPARRHTWVKK